MMLKTMSKQLGKLSRDCERLARRVEIGKITEAEKRRKANELASKSLALFYKAWLLPYPATSKYLQNLLLEMAVRLKYIAAKSSSKPRKGYNIQHKVVKFK